MISGDTLRRATPIRRSMAEVSREIDALFSQLLIPPEDPSSRLIEAMRYAAIGGGKRLRPLLTCASADLFGVPRSLSLRAGLAVECVHVHSLIHDDLPCMDDDDLRRGKPTVHKAFDEATAVLAGDALQANAFYVLSEADTHADPGVRAELCRGLARAAGPRGMCGGQILDMLAEEAGEPLEEAEIGRLQLLKTGKLIEFAAEAGAILGKAPGQLRHALAAYG